MEEGSGSGYWGAYRPTEENGLLRDSAVLFNRSICPKVISPNLCLNETIPCRFPLRENNANRLLELYTFREIAIGWRPMHVRSHPLFLRSRQRRFAAPAASALVSLLTSCASPGPPRPPSLHLPEVMNDLAAQRAGQTVHLHWTTPSRTTDRLTAPSPMTAEICREASPAPESHESASAALGQTIPPPQSVPGCDPAVRLAVKPGETDADDQLPSELAAGEARLIRYRIRILNPGGHSAGYSRGTMALAGAAPPPIQLKASATRYGAVLEWQPSEPGSWIELDRKLPAAPKSNKPKKKASLSLPENEPAEIRLRAGGDGAQAPDPGGTLDRGARRGESYRYTAQRVRTVELDGHRYELRGAVSPTVELTMTDRFPPSAPTELAAIPGAEGDILTIDLSWQPSSEADIAGYNVYRREGATGEFERVSKTPVLGPAFSDLTVVPGHSYTYRVTAVDGSGNEGPASNEITEKSPKSTNPDR